MTERITRRGIVGFDIWYIMAHTVPRIQTGPGMSEPDPGSECCKLCISMRNPNEIPRILTVTVLVLALGACGYAQPARHAHVDIRAEALNETSTIRVIIAFSVDSGWYTYWKNPGDSGLPPGFAWTLPAGCTVEDVRFPVPEKILHDESVIYGYTKDFQLTTVIRIPDEFHAGGTVLQIRADLEWLVCKERCLKEDTSITFNLLRSDAFDRSGFDARWVDAQSRMPYDFRDAGFAVDSVSMRKSPSGMTLSLHFGTGGGDGPSDFFPESIGNAVVELASIRATDRTLTMAVVPENPSEPIGTVTGLLFHGGKAYECVFPLTIRNE